MSPFDQETANVQFSALLPPEERQKAAQTLERLYAERSAGAQWPPASPHLVALIAPARRLVEEPEEESPEPACDAYIPWDLYEDGAE